MAIKLTCPGCGKSYSFSEKMGKKTVTCTECKKKIKVVSDSDRLAAEKRKSIKCTCPECGKPLTVPGEMNRKKIKCPGCKAKFPVISNSERLKILQDKEEEELEKAELALDEEIKLSGTDTVHLADIDGKPERLPGFSICSRCSKQLPDHFFGTSKAIRVGGKTYCAACSPLKICPRCSETVQTAARICWRCGLSFEDPGIEEVAWTWFVASVVIPFAGIAFPIAAIIQQRKGGCALLFVSWIVNLIYAVIFFYMLTPASPPG